jgi:hypothetical protein
MRNPSYFARFPNSRDNHRILCADRHFSSGEKRALCRGAGTTFWGTDRDPPAHFWIDNLDLICTNRKTLEKTIHSETRRDFPGIRTAICVILSALQNEHPKKTRDF